MMQAPHPRLGELLLCIRPRDKASLEARILHDWQEKIDTQFQGFIDQANFLLNARVAQVLDHDIIPDDGRLATDNVKQLLFSTLHELVTLASNNRPAFDAFYREKLCAPQRERVSAKVGLLQEYDLLSGVSVHFAREYKDMTGTDIWDINEGVILAFLQREFARRRTPDLLGMEITLATLSGHVMDLLQRVNALENRPPSQVPISIPSPQGTAFEPITFE